jgi:dUTP pyrophosphatase
MREAEALCRAAKAVLNVPTDGWGPLESKLGGLHEAVIQYEAARGCHHSLKVMRERPDVTIPSRTYPGDAGFDLYCSVDVLIPRHGFKDVPMGVRIEMPMGHWALLTGRSSAIRRRGILVVNGIIDWGWRGPLFAACQNMTDEDILVRRDERVAQLIPMVLPHEKWEMEVVEELSESERGESGFGSSGT